MADEDDSHEQHAVHLFKKEYEQNRNEMQNRQYHGQTNKFAQRQFEHAPPGPRNDDNSYSNEGNSNKNNNNNINTSQPPPNIFQNQYRPSNPMFNSPPPNFNRPPMGNGPPNRIWNDGHNNSGNVINQNFQQSHNVWNQPPNTRGMNFQQNMNRMNSPRNMRGMPFNNPFSSGPRFGSFNLTLNNPNNNNNNNLSHLNNRLNPSQNINNLTSPVIGVNNSEPNFATNQNVDQDDRLMPSQSDKVSVQSADESSDLDGAKQDVDLRSGQQNVNRNIDEDDRLKTDSSSESIADESKEHTTDAINKQQDESISLHNASETNTNNINESELNQSRSETKTDEITPTPPRKFNPFSQPPRIASNLFSSIENCSTQVLNNLFHHNNIEGQGQFRSPSPVALNQRNIGNIGGGGNRPVPLLMTPPSIIPPLMRGGMNRGGTAGGSPYFRPNLNDGSGGGRGAPGGRGGWGSNIGMRNAGPMRGMSPANRRGIGGNTMLNNSNRGRISDPGPGNFRGNFRGNW